jgi:hypothetical protein
MSYLLLSGHNVCLPLIPPVYLFLSPVQAEMAFFILHVLPVQYQFIFHPKP